MSAEAVARLEQKLALVTDARREIARALALLDDVLVELKDELADARRGEAAETDT